MLYGALATVALLLAAVGVYGVMAFSIVQRTQEIGVRMALGAEPGARPAADPARRRDVCAGGLTLGVAGAYGLGRAMQNTLFGTGPINVPVLLAVSVVLLASALLACYVPARRASALDPMIALRQE